jgi:hypothetical protein
MKVYVYTKTGKQQKKKSEKYTKTTKNTEKYTKTGKQQNEGLR